MAKCEEHTGCVTQIENNKSDIGTLFEILEKVRNRLPIWAAAVIAGQAGIIGWLLSAKGIL